jgi:hypothetical protein
LVTIDVIQDNSTCFCQAIAFIILRFEDMLIGTVVLVSSKILHMYHDVWLLFRDLTPFFFLI